MEVNKNIILELDDSDVEMERQKNDRNKWMQLKKYAPFLEFITKVDPNKYEKFTHILEWLKKNQAYPCSMANKCEEAIKSRYAKMKTVTNFPANIIAIFDETDSILISDEDDDCLPQSSVCIQTAGKETTASKSEPLISLNSQLTNLSINPNTQSNHRDKLVSKTESAPPESGKPAPEEGEITSDNDDVIIVLEVKDDPQENKQVENISQVNENTNTKNLWKRRSHSDEIEPFTVSKNIDNLSKVILVNQTKLLYEESRQSPIVDLLSPVSDGCNFNIANRKKKKKKHKHRKRSRSEKLQEENKSENDKTSKKKTYRRESPLKDDASKSKKNSKNNTSDSIALMIQRVALLISDDEESIKSVEDLPSTPEVCDPVNIPEEKLFVRRDTVKKNNETTEGISSCRSNFTLLDSNDNNVNVIQFDQSQSVSVIQETSSKSEGYNSEVSITNAEELRHPQRTSSVEEHAANSSKSAPPSALDKASSSVSETVEEPTKSLRDIDSMGLEELNDIYVRLCQTTGIPLEGLLKEMINQSTCKDNNQQTHPNQNVSPNSNNIENLEVHQGSNLYNFPSYKNKMAQHADQQQLCHQQQLQFQQYQQQFQVQQQKQVLFAQQHMNNNVPNGYNQQQNTLQPKLNLKDPRIIQQLKHIKDSSVHSDSIRYSANFLINHYFQQQPQPKPNPAPVAEVVTSKTARTYGEHKRLRELESKQALAAANSKLNGIASQSAPIKEANDKQNVVLSQSIPIKETNVKQNGVSSQPSPVMEGNSKQNGASSESIAKKETSKHKQKRSSESDGASSSKTAEHDEIPIEPKTIMSFSLNKEARRRIAASPSPTQDQSSSGRITSFERERVVNFVLSAIEQSKDNSAKPEKSRTKSKPESTSPRSKNDETKIAHPSKKHIENQPKHNTKETPKKSHKKQSSSIEEQPTTSVKSSTKTKKSTPYSRELQNLNCTILGYKEMFERNTLPTIGGKRRCSVAQPSRPMSYTSSDSSDSEAPQEVRPARIQNRRQTCSALNPLKVVFRRLSGEGNFGVKTVDKNNDSDDTDEFDIEEHRRKKQTQHLLEQTLKVKLKKLSMSEIKKTLKLQYETPQKPHHSNEIPILVPITSEPVESSKKLISKAPKCTNTDITMTLTATKLCAICNKRPFDLTNHYITQHRTESYVSRLTSEKIDELEANITFAAPWRKRFKITCIFCQDELEDHFVNFHAHYSFHTGEYGFKCDVCELMKPYKEDIRSHQLRASRCRNSKIRTNYLYSPDLTVIYLYVCRICNFVQLNEANIHKHHRDHHGFKFDEPQQVRRCIIAAIDEESLIGNLDYCDKDSDNLLSQEQEFLHECPLDIKDVLSPETQARINEESELRNSSPGANSLQNTIEIRQKGCLTPEELLESLYGSENLNKIMTVIHCGGSSSSQEIHQPFAETVDVKPDISKVKIEPQLWFLNQSKADVTSPAVKILETRISDKEFPTVMIPDLRAINVEGTRQRLGGRPAVIEQTSVKPTDVQTANVQPTHVISANERPVDVGSTSEDLLNMEHQNGPRSLELKRSVVNQIIKKHDVFNHLYKCLINDCSFSIDQATNLIIHLSNHGGKDDTRLDCAYCTLQHPCIDKLVRHARNGCSGLVPEKLAAHRQLLHKDSTANKSILQCAESIKNLEQNILDIENKMKENITKLQCPQCPSSFYATASIESHIRKEHPVMESVKFSDYACMHCKEQFDFMSVIQAHMAVIHPTELNYIVERKLKTNNYKDCIKNLKIVSIKPPFPSDEMSDEMHSELIHGCDEQKTNEETTPSDGEKILECILMDETSADYERNKEMQSLVQCLRTLLELFTENSGFCRSTLYRCSACNASFFTYELWLAHVKNRHGIAERFACPYCEKQIALGQASSHFNSHGRHEHICFHCTESFYSRDRLSDHFSLCHVQCPSFMEKTILVGARNYYLGIEPSLGVNINVLGDWVPHLRAFAEKLSLKCIQKLQLNTSSEWSTGLTSSIIEEIYIPQYVNENGNSFKCLVQSCPFIGSNDSDLTSHLNEHTIPRYYQCPHCVDSICEPSWDGIKNHIMLHKSTIYVCCVCKYLHYNQCEMAKHVERLHNCRDVAVISLWRDGVDLKTSLSIVLPPKKVSFTSLSCLCCKQDMKTHKKYLHHLKTEHSITLRPKCAFCDKILLTPAESDSHGAEHEMDYFKLKYNVLTASHLSLIVKSLCPFTIEIRVKREKRNRSECEKSPLKKMRLDEQPAAVKVKEEIVIKSEAEENAGESEVPAHTIKCRSIDQLVVKETAQTNDIPDDNIVNVPEQRRIYVKSIAELQPSASSSILQYQQNGLVQVPTIATTTSSSQLSNIVSACLNQFNQPNGLRQQSGLPQTNGVSQTNVVRLHNGATQPNRIPHPNMPPQLNRILQPNGIKQPSGEPQPNVIPPQNMAPQSYRILQPNGIQQSSGTPQPNGIYNQQASHQQPNQSTVSPQLGNQYRSQIAVPHPSTQFSQQTVTQHPSHQINVALHKAPQIGPIRLSNRLNQQAAAPYAINQTNQQTTTCSNSQTSHQYVQGSRPSTLHLNPAPSPVHLNGQMTHQIRAQYSNPPVTQNQPQNRFSINVQLPNCQGTAVISRPMVPTNPPPRQVHVPSATDTSTLPTQLHLSATNSDARLASQQNSAEETESTCDPILPEIVPICEYCNCECLDFSALRMHFEKNHAPKNFRFLYRLARKVKCMYCSFMGSLDLFAKHHKTCHSDKSRLCSSVMDNMRCGMCDEPFGTVVSSTGSLSPMCTCPGRPKVLADCLDPNTMRMLLKFGKKTQAYLCTICTKTFPYAEECTHHMLSAHDQRNVPPKLWPIEMIWYRCGLCENTTTSIKENIEHVLRLHLASPEERTFDERMKCYANIVAIFPMGLIMRIKDLKSMGMMAEDKLQRIVQSVEGEFFNNTST